MSVQLIKGGQSSNTDKIILEKGLESMQGMTARKVRGGSAFD